jgi:hypothetical protein
MIESEGITDPFPNPLSSEREWEGNGKAPYQGFHSKRNVTDSEPLSLEAKQAFNFFKFEGLCSHPSSG